MTSKIEIINTISDADMKWFSAQYKNHNVVGFMKETFETGSITRVILKMKPGHKGWTPFGTARDCGNHYIVARYSKYDRIDKNNFEITEDVADK